MRAGRPWFRHPAPRHAQGGRSWSALRGRRGAQSTDQEVGERACQLLDSERSVGTVPLGEPVAGRQDDEARQTNVEWAEAAVDDPLGDRPPPVRLVHVPAFDNGATTPGRKRAELDLEKRELAEVARREVEMGGDRAPHPRLTAAFAFEFGPDALFEPVEHVAHDRPEAVSYTHLRAHETVLDLVCRLLLEKKK